MTQPLRPRRLIHRGTVLASGLVVDTQSTGEEEARRRVLRELSAEAGEVSRVGQRYVVRFRRGSHRRCDVAQGSLLTRCGALLTAAPLDRDEERTIAEAFGAPGMEHVVVAEGGELAVLALGGESVDVARWLDVSSFDCVADVDSLGEEALLPAASAAPVSEDVRSALAAPPLPEAGRLLLAALTNAAGSDAGKAGPAAAPWSEGSARTLGAAGVVHRLLASLFSVLGAVASDAPPSGPLSRSGVGRATPSMFDSLASLVRRAAVRLLVWARLGPLLGRKHATYVASLLDAFERGDVDDVLRRGLPLSREGTNGSDVPALGFADRRDLEIRPAATRAASSVLLGDGLFMLLREKYRRLVSLLQSRGDVDKAAFVLAELLQENEEAVAFLQKHGKFGLAAKLAEARGLAPSVVIRSLFLAGDKDRAVALARRTGAFADAVTHLERSHPNEGRALRIVWANVLAEQGAFAAAVDVIWPIEEARALSLVWLEHAIAVGGPTAMRALVKKLVLQPEAFTEARERFRECVSVGLDDEPAERATIALGEELLIQTPNAATRLLARLVVRELLHRAPLGKDRATSRLTWGLLDVAGDSVLRADVTSRAGFRQLTGEPSGALLVRAANATLRGKVRTTNEDASFSSLLDQSAPWQSSIAGRVDLNGLLLAAIDGVVGLSPPNLAAVELTRHVWQSLCDNHRSTEGGSFSSGGLADACRAANRRLLRETSPEPGLGDSAASGTFATVEGDTLIVVHAGGTRGYVLREGRLTRITTEHTLTEMWRRWGHRADEATVPDPIVSGYGARDDVELDVLRLELRRGDVVMLCTDGLWRTVEDDQIRQALTLATPEQACGDLVGRAEAAGAPDNVAVVVARFDGPALLPSNGAPVSIELQRFDAQGDAVAPLGSSAPSTPSARVDCIRRSRADVGAIPVRDAYELPDGRLLLALGEMGLRLIARDGRTLVSFKEPAHRLIPSDEGARVIVATSRGASTQLARLDLTTKRLRPWCDARIDVHARDFDGGIWYVACGDALFAIDALADGWKHLWSVSEMAGGRGRVTSIVRAPTQQHRQHASFRALVAYADLTQECWTFQSDHQVLRARSPLPLDEERMHSGGEFQLASAGEVFLWRHVVDVAGATKLVGEHWRKGPGWRTFVSCGEELPLTPMGNERWSVFPTRTSEGMTIRVLDVRNRHQEPLAIHLEGVATGRSSTHEVARLQGNRLVISDDDGRVLVIALDARRVVRDLRIT